MRHRRGCHPSEGTVADPGKAFENAAKQGTVDRRTLDIACDTRGTLTGSDGHGINKPLLDFLIKAKLRGHKVTFYDPLGYSSLNGAEVIGAMTELGVPQDIQARMVASGMFHAVDRASLVQGRVFDAIFDDDLHHYSGSQARLYAHPLSPALQAFLTDFNRNPDQDLGALLDLYLPPLEPVSEIEAKPGMESSEAEQHPNPLAGADNDAPDVRVA